MMDILHHGVNVGYLLTNIKRSVSMKFRQMFIFIGLIVALSFAVTTPKVVQVYNVQDYGATGGDQTPDDVAIQAAITDAANHDGWGCVIYFPAGSYILNNPLMVGTGVAGSPLTSGITFEGESTDNTQLKPRGKSAFIFAGGDTVTTDYTTWYEHCTNYNTIKNLEIVKDDASTRCLCAIDLNHASGTTIENVKIIMNNASGHINVGIRGTMDYLTIMNCYISRYAGTVDTGISLDNHPNLRFNPGSFPAGPVDGARIGLTTLERCGIGIFEHAGQACNLIADNTFVNCSTTGIKVYADNDNCIWGLTIRGNQMEGNGISQHNAIWIQRIAPFLAKGITIQGNFFNIQDGATLTSPYDITDQTQLAQCTFINNVYRVYGGTQVSEGLTVGAIPIPSTTSPMLYVGGNTGLGTSTVGSKLQINGNTAIGYSASTAAPANGLAVYGNVGIGTPAPSTKLDVNGKIRATNGANAALNIPILSANPTYPSVGDVWIHGTGTPCYLRVRVNSTTTKSILLN
jgi:hypothetical protein